MAATKNAPSVKYVTVKCPVCGKLFHDISVIEGAGRIIVRKRCKKCKKIRKVILEL